MAIWVCKQCNIEFKRDKAGKRPVMFCSVNCYHGWRKQNNIKAGCFKKGQKPWNKNKKGIHLSPLTEFKKGQESAKKLPVGSVTFRQRKREGYTRAWIKIAEPNEWKPRAIFVWEKHFGKLSKGFIIHHKDRNPLNDDISNLQKMTRAEHAREHAKDR